MRHISTVIALTGLFACLLVSALPHAASAASFDCERADLAADEKVICDTRSLNDADVKMVTTFDLLTGLMPMGNRDKLRDDQSAWLKKRQACGEDVDCIRATYDERLKQLDEAYRNLNRPL
ncbi:lysozyme inhibitor LprI family protein [Rhizobium puerariae]|uniref:Lysozyme inhibitor LprI family protein n=1 Tax=Rhizobium puerariae TaxID=1585791 RepID=A0ABV6ASL4_9HYPH